MILALRGGLWRGGWRRSVAVGLVLLLGAGVLPVLAASVSVLPAAADPVPDASLCSGQAYSKWLDTVDARVRFFVPKGRTIDMSLTTWGVAGGYTASYAATVESSGSTVTLANTVSGHQDAHTGAPEDGVSLGTVASAPYDRVFTVSLSYAGRSITAWQFVWQITQGASFGCDPQAPNANSAALHDDPVDVASGNLLGHEVDLSVPAGASRLAVVDRYLNNFDGSMRSLGPKWKFGFDGRLVKVIDGVWELREASGAVWQFREDGSGGWTSPSEYLARLTYDAGSARYVVSRPDRTKDWFNAAGNLVQRTDASGSVVSISRSSGGAITSIASGTYSVAFEDTLALNSAGVPVAGSDGYVDRAVSSDGRVVRYGYNKDVVKGSTVLGSVSEPHSPAADAAPSRAYGQTRYTTSKTWVEDTYRESTPGSERLVVDNTLALGESGPQGMVLSQTTEGGGTSTFSYGRRPASLTGAYGGALVNDGGWTTVDHSSGDRVVYHFNQAGEVLQTYDPAGKPVERTWVHGDPDSVESRSDVTGDVTFDAAGRPVSIAQVSAGGSRPVSSVTYLTAASAAGAAQDRRLTTSTDRAGVVTEYGYTNPTDPYPSTVKRPCDGSSSAVACPAGGKVTTSIDYATAPGLAGLPIRVVDPDGVKIEFTYNADRTVASSKTFPTASTPLTTSYAYLTPSSTGWSETDPRVVKVVTVTGPDLAVTVSKYDGSGRLVEQRDPLFNGTSHKAIRLTYSADGQLTSVTDPGDAVMVVQHLRPSDAGWPAGSPTAAKEVTITTDPDGVQALGFTDANGDQIASWAGKLSEPATLAKTTYAYGQLGRMLTSTDPKGVKTTYTYDVEGRVLTTTVGPNATDPAHRASTAYDAWGQTTASTGPDETAPGSTTVFNSQTTYTYDTAGRVKSIVEGAAGPADQKLMTSYVYDTAGRLWRTVEHRSGSTASPPPAITAGDKVTETRYTLAGRTKQTVTPGPDNAAFDWGSADSAKSITEVFYDGAGRQTRVRDPRGKDTTTTYDPAGRVDVVTSPAGAWVDYTYDAAGQVTGVTRPTGLASPATVTESRTYRADGRLKTETAAGASTPTQYSYTAGGRVDTVTDPLGAVTRYGYDALGRQAKRTSLVDNTEELWTWDTAGNLKTNTVPAVAVGGPSQTTTYSYDYDDANPANDYGRLVSITDPTGRVETRSYYGSGDLKTQTYTATGLPTITSARTLNSRGWLTSLVDTTGTASRTTNYEMDRAGKRIHQWGPEGELFYKWDLAGNLTELTYPDGAKFGYTHLKTGQINEFKSWFAAWSTFVLIANYTYDDDGAETSEWIFGAGGNSRTWARNSARQVTDFDESMNTGSGWENYNADLTYDARGNLASETVNAGTTAAMTYDAAGQLRTQTGATPASYTYNARGTRTASSFNGASTTYTANPNGSIATATTGTSVVTYGYDHAGRRTSETTNVSGTTTATSTTTYNAAGKPATRTNTGAVAFTETRAYDGLGQLVESDYTSGSTTANYTFTWDTTTAVSKPLLTKINGTTAVRMDYSNRLLDYQGGFYPTWYKLDARNSVIKPTANPAAADGPASYDPYGTTNFTWFGPSYRSELQLINQIHLRNRDYDPTTGQFTTQDPLDGINGTTTLTNPYHYVDNNPHNHVDPLGLLSDMTFDDALNMMWPQAQSQFLDGLPNGCAGLGSNIGIEFMAACVGELLIISAFDEQPSESMSRLCGSGTHVSEFCLELVQALTDLHEHNHRIEALDAFTDLPNALWDILPYTGCVDIIKGEADIADDVGCALDVLPLGAIAGHLAGTLPLGSTDEAAEALEGAIDANRGADNVIAESETGLADEIARGLCHSFDPRTEVLMANGSHKRIRDVRVGDWVLTAIPSSGTVVPRRVTEVHTSKDIDLLDVVVREARGHEATIHTTQRHRFWSERRRDWIEARLLSPGEALYGLNRESVTVSSIRAVGGARIMYDLTIEDVHAFYVEVNNASVLVHNCTASQLGGNAAGLDVEELAQAAFQHAGEGDLVSTPTLEQILSALETDGVRLPGQNAVRFSEGDVVVIINEDLPWRSTAYIRGGS